MMDIGIWLWEILWGDFCGRRKNIVMWRHSLSDRCHPVVLFSKQRDCVLIGALMNDDGFIMCSSFKVQYALYSKLWLLSAVNCYVRVDVFRHNGHPIDKLLGLSRCGLGIAPHTFLPYFTKRDIIVTWYSIVQLWNNRTTPIFMDIIKTDIIKCFNKVQRKRQTASCQLPVSQTSWPALQVFFLRNAAVKCTLLSDGSWRTEHSSTQTAIDGTGTEHTMLAV